MKEDEFRALFLQLSAFFSQANVFWRQYEESENKWNREGWIFQFRETLDKARACLRNIPDEDVFLLLEQFEGSMKCSPMVQDFFRGYFGERFIEKLRYDIEQTRIPRTGPPHDGLYDSEWN